MANPGENTQIFRNTLKNATRLQEYKGAKKPTFLCRLVAPLCEWT